MKAHLYMFSLVLLLLSAGCFGGDGNFNADAEAIRQSKINLQQITLSITAEQIFEASKYIHDDFVLEAAVAAKFDVGPFQGKGPDAFKEFFGRVIDKYGDLNLTVTVTWSEAENNLVSLHSHVSFSGDNGNAAPQADISFEENDLFVFAWNGSLYALLHWGEDPNPNGHGHDEGGGGDF